MLLGKKLCLTFELYFGSNLIETLSKLNSGGLFGCVFSWKADSEVYNSSHAVKEDIPAQHESHKALYLSLFSSVRLNEFAKFYGVMTKCGSVNHYKTSIFVTLNLTSLIKG